MKCEKYPRKQETIIKCEILPSKQQRDVSELKIVANKFKGKVNREKILLGKNKPFFEKIFSRKKECDVNHKFATVSELKKYI